MTTSIARVPVRTAAQTTLAALVAAVIALALVHLAPDAPTTAPDSPRDLFSTSPGNRDLRTAPGKAATSDGAATKQGTAAPLSTDERVLMASRGGTAIVVEELTIAHEGFEPAAGSIHQQGRVLLDADLNSQ